MFLVISCFLRSNPSVIQCWKYHRVKHLVLLCCRNYVPSFLCIWPVNPNHCAVRNLCPALRGQPQPAKQTFTGGERFCRQRLVALLHLGPNRSLHFFYPHRCTCVNGAGIHENLRPFWSQHKRLQAVPSVQSQATSEGGWRKRCASICDPNFLNKFSLSR